MGHAAFVGCCHLPDSGGIQINPHENQIFVCQLEDVELRLGPYGEEFVFGGDGGSLVLVERVEERGSLG